MRELFIEDDNFTCNKEYVLNFCNEVSLRKLDIVFSCANGIRLDSLDKEMLELMEKAGFYSISVGIESGSERILKLMRKNLSPTKIKEKIRLIKRYTKINVTGFFLIGYPGETYSEIIETINFAQSLNIDKASFAFVLPLPGTELWEVYIQRNSREITFEDFFLYRTVKGMSDIPEEMLHTLQKKAMREFYLRPKIILKLLNQLKTSNQWLSIAKRLRDLYVSK